MRALHAVLAIAMAAPLLAGCLASPEPAPLPSLTFADLTAEGAKVTDLASGVRAFAWETTTQAHSSTPPYNPGIDISTVPYTTQPIPSVNTPLPTLLTHKFQVGPKVGYVQLDATIDMKQALIAADLIDEFGRVQCRALGYPGPNGLPGTCTAPVARNVTGPRDWTVRVLQFTNGAGGVPLQAIVSLHPAGHETHGDALQGVDPAITFRAIDTRVPGSEDNLGVLRDGSIVAQMGLQTIISRDNGETWTNINPPWELRERSADPMLRVDPYTNSIYVAQLQRPEFMTALSWSTDGGYTWLHNRAVGLPLADHEKLATGAHPVPGSPVPAVYYSYAEFEALPADPVAFFAQGDGASVYAARSFDGGASFTSVPVAGYSGDGLEPANTGPIEADRLGNVFVPMNMCDKGGYMGVGVSHDFGQSYHFVKAAPGPANCESNLDPGIAVDSADNVYIAYSDAAGVKYAASKDHGESWSPPVAVSLPQLKSWAHVDGVAGDDGKLAIVYRATADSAKMPSNADGWAIWDTYVAFVDSALDTPMIRTAMVNPADDPVQRGCIWQFGGSNPCRNLLDFVDIQLTPEGKVVVVYTDGCRRACETPADSRLRMGIVGIEDQGPTLFAGKAPWAKARSATEPSGLAALTRAR